MDAKHVGSVHEMRVRVTDPNALMMIFDKLPEHDRIVIPAKNEAGTIGHVLAYLTHSVLKPEQILVVVNGCTDNTAQIANAYGVRVVEQRKVLGDAILIADLESRFGLTEKRLHGKGTAMFAAGLELKNDKLSDDSRVYFFDADVRNIRQAQPLEHLRYAWKNLPEDRVRIVKLALHGRSNEGIHAFLGLHGNPWRVAGCLQWPLCGQMSIRWSDFSRMRLGTGYSAEIAMLMCIAEWYGLASGFGEVELETPLHDKLNGDREHVRMFTTIMSFMHELWTRNKKLTALTEQEIKCLNMAATGKTGSMWTPAPPHSGACGHEPRILDGILPAVVEL